MKTAAIIGAARHMAHPAGRRPRRQATDRHFPAPAPDIGILPMLRGTTFPFHGEVR